MADDTIQNRAELEYTARVNRESFASAREEVRRETEQAASQSKQAASGSVSGAGTSAAEFEEIRRIRAERDKARNEKNAARFKESNDQRVISEEEFRIASRLNTQKNRFDEDEIKRKRQVRDETVKLAGEKAKAEEAAYRSGARINTIYPGVGPAEFTRTGGYRSSLLARASDNELSEFRAAQAASGGSGGGGGPLGRGFGRFAERRAIAEAGYLVGAPEVGQVASLAAYGPQFAAVGGTLAAVAATVKAVEAYNAERKAIQDLNRELIVTNQSFGTISASTESFTSQLHLSSIEALTLSTSLAVAADKAGLKLSSAQTGQLTNLLQNRGFDTAQQEKFIKQIGTDLPGAFEEVTKRNPAVFLDEYAKSIGTTSDRLTILQTNQVLFDEILKRSGDGAAIAAAHVNSLGGEYERLFGLFKSGLAFTGGQAVGIISDLASHLTLQGKDYGYYTYQAGTADEDAKQAELNRRAIAENLQKKKRESDVAILSAQQTALQTDQERFKDIGKLSSVSPLTGPQGEFKALQVQKQALEDYQAEVLKSTTLESAARKKLLDETKDAVVANAKSIDAVFAETSKKIADAAKAFRDSFGEIASLQLVGTDNPYVKLFSESATSLQHFKEQFPLLSDEAVKSFDRMKQAQIESAVYQQRVKDNLTATKLEFEATQLSKPFIELTGEMKRTLSVFDAELKTLSGPGLLFAARQLESGGHAFLPSLPGPLQGLAGQQLQGLESLTRKYAGEGGRGGEELQHLLNQQFIKLYEGLSPQDRQSVFRFGGARNEFANAYRGEERYGRQQLDLTIQRAEVSRGVIQEAELQLKELQRLSGTRGADPNVTRAQFLAITGSIPREELTPDLIKGRTAALKEQAAFDRSREKQASDAVAATAKFQESILERLKEMQTAIKSRNDSVLIQVQDATDKTKITLGNGYTPGSSEVQPTPNDLARQIQGMH